MVEKRGRPSRRQLDEQTGAIVWQRLVEKARDVELDLRITSQIGRLRLRGLLTDTQAAACDAIGRIYGRYERHHRVSRTTRSPSYEFTTARERDLDEPVPGEPAYDAWREKIDAITADYDAVQRCMPAGREVRDIIERLCVENQAVTGFELGRIYGTLNRVSELFALGPPPEESEAQEKRADAAARQRKSRAAKAKEGAYAARTADATPTMRHAAGSAGERDHAALVRQLEERQAKREAAAVS